MSDWKSRLGVVYSTNPDYQFTTEEDCVEEQEDEVVLEVLQKGYMYKDRVLRTAMVKVNE